MWHSHNTDTQAEYQHDKAAASGASDDTKLWQREGPRPEKNERKRVCSQPKWYAVEIDGLKDIEMRATMYLAE